MVEKRDGPTTGLSNFDEKKISRSTGSTQRTPSIPLASYMFFDLKDTLFHCK